MGNGFSSAKEAGIAEKPMGQNAPPLVSTNEARWRHCANISQISTY